MELLSFHAVFMIVITLSRNYCEENKKDKKMVRKAPIDDSALVFDNPKQPSQAA